MTVTTRTEARGASSVISRSKPLMPYLGATLVVIGFGFISFTWGRVAGLGSVALQLPYIASGAFTGLGLIVCGVSILAATSASRDAQARQESLARLSRSMDEILLVLSEEHVGKDPGQALL